jgi:hypothetical protein
VTGPRDERDLQRWEQSDLSLELERQPPNEET